jgi:hypothetical protein
LSDESQRARFICGNVTRRAAGVLIEPICIVMEDKDGKRRAIQPWIDTKATETATDLAQTTEAAATSLAIVLNEVSVELSELMINGLRRAGPMEASRWKQLATQLAQCGLTRISERAGRLGELISARSEQVSWDHRIALTQAMHLLLLSRMAEDIPIDT